MQQRRRKSFHFAEAERRGICASTEKEAAKLREWGSGQGRLAPGYMRGDRRVRTARGRMAQQ